LFFTASLLSAQESILNSYERNFARSNLAAKAAVLRDAATDDRAGEFIGQLYEFALNFAIQNVDILRYDSDMAVLIMTAARGMATVGYGAGIATLWSVFSVYQDSLVRVELVRSLGRLGTENPGVVENLNQFLADQNNLFGLGETPDYLVMSASIGVLASLGNDSSFPALFSVYIRDYPDTIHREALSAMESLTGEYERFLTAVIRDNSMEEKLIALQMAMHNAQFTSTQRGDFAELALETGLASVSGDQRSVTAMNELRYIAIQTLMELRRTRAVALVIRHFYRVQQDYGNGVAPLERLLEAISCMGVMGSSEAAQALALQLAFLNSQMGQGRAFDEPVILGLINALGEIGDKIAFEYLDYVSSLPYPDSIQTAAGEALNRLRW
jgi:hypothetical protein